MSRLDGTLHGRQIPEKAGDFIKPSLVLFADGFGKGINPPTEINQGVIHVHVYDGFVTGVVFEGYLDLCHITSNSEIGFIFSMRI